MSEKPDLLKSERIKDLEAHRTALEKRNAELASENKTLRETARGQS